jgi:hypothetical protein
LASLSIGGTVGQEIRNAVNAGKEVTVHEKAISAFGWSGYGYSITDPETGASGYLLEGSGNGGYFLGVLNGFSLAALLAGIVFSAPISLVLILTILLAASMIAANIALMSAEDPSALACYAKGMNGGISAYGLISLFLAIKLPPGVPDRILAAITGTIIVITQRVNTSLSVEC